ncbi:exodeoxyribonuclease VII large subunit [Kocuria sp. TGY1127_2]|uniref:exodeoxyribonuclease VII large subunit n=1 Tax=Kocuria sp. TGY1127_2 TaxID=2711328 RepID=UPI0015C10ED1|nr:exodeoxyribonuclease VII large subunit [Kocuria sp. TGY1127_2]
MSNSPSSDQPDRTEAGLGAADQTQRPPLPNLARDTTPENPWPLHLLSAKMNQYISRCDPIWVEGQIIELKKRARVTYLTLRDLEEEISVPVSLFPKETARIEGDLEHGMRVIVRLKPDFWKKTGRLSMLGSGIRQVGLGDMLERIERLRRKLQAEGLFNAALKKPLPVLPQKIGLITGRDSDAEKDVIRNARLRWPGAQFEVREVAVQGVNSLSQVTAALGELDEDASVDVIVIARGGGALEDLLPFSEEAMIRAVAQASTPVVSAIGHEADQPLLDYVADWRASTPTDAGKTVVPDVEEERLRIGQARATTERVVRLFIDRESNGLAQYRSRPVLAHPETMLMAREEETDAARARVLRAVTVSLDRHQESVAHLRSRVRSLSPQKTLDRGYAVVQSRDGSVVQDARTLEPGIPVEVRVAAGGFEATVDKIRDDDPRDQPG